MQFGNPLQSAIGRTTLFSLGIFAGIVSASPLYAQDMGLMVEKSAPMMPEIGGTGTIVDAVGDRFDITGGQRSQDGTNLFHSFERFNLDSGQVANFDTTAATRNVITRVVGGDLSAINGLLQVSGSQANLYFINPAGMVFGANASLNLGGSFTATTANGLGFDGNWFNAIGRNNYSALNGSPDQYAFTMQQPGGILNVGNLGVTEGQSLNLIAGTVVSTGQLEARGGQITVAAVPGESTVRLRPSGSLISLEIQPLNSTATQPNAWSLAIADLPALLTGGLGKSATDISVNEDGQVVLEGSGLTVQPGDAVVQNLTAQQATLSASGQVTVGNTPLPTPANATVYDSIRQPLTITANTNTYILTTPEGQGFYIQDGLEVVFDFSGSINPGIPDIPLLPPDPPSLIDGARYDDSEQSLIGSADGSFGSDFSTKISVPPDDSPPPSIALAPPPLPQPINTQGGSSETGSSGEIALAPPPLPQPTNSQSGSSDKGSLASKPGAKPSFVTETTSTVGAETETLNTTSTPIAEPESQPTAPTPPIQQRSLTKSARSSALTQVATTSAKARNTSRESKSVTIATKSQDCWQAGQTVASAEGRYQVITDQHQVIQCYQTALAIAQRQQDSAQVKTIRQNLGSSYFVVGSYGQSIQQYQESLAVTQRLQDATGQAQALSGLGAAYSALGNYDQAIHYYDQSLKISNALDAPELQGMTLRNLGVAYLAQGNSAQALKYAQQSLEITQRAQDQRGIGQSLGSLGLAYYFQGDYTQAIAHLKQQLAIAQQTQDSLAAARALGNLGLAYAGRKDFSQAVKYQQQALAIAQQLQDRPTEGHALNNLGEAFLRSGQLAEAERTLRAGIELWESLRAELGAHDSNKVSLFDTQAATYALLQETLVAQKNPQAALEIAERGRARAFVELLARQTSDASQSLPAQPKPPTIDEIQQLARQQDATLVAYSILQDAFDLNGSRQVKDSLLYIWVVSPQGKVDFRQVDLKPLWQTEGTSLDELVASSRASIGIAGRGLAFNQNTEAIASALERLQQQQAKSSRLKRLHQLLIEPIADLLPTNPNNRVVLIPQGSLFLVPFPALQTARGDYLIEQHTLLTAPAIQVLALTHQQRQRQILSSQTQGVQVATTQPFATQPQSLIVGNPTMPSLPGVAQSRSLPLQSLPGAEYEAKLIAELLDTEAITGSEATKATVLSRMPQARMIHLATHGLLDDFRGTGVPGAIALAPSGKDDGLLTAEDILQLKLTAELVVLSACDTGRGRITGDGVIGLSRSLISAGVPSVVVSLWQVPDAPTATLMTEFYQNLQQHSDKAQALRQAMLSTMRQHPDPKDWAAFTLIGEAE